MAHGFRGLLFFEIGRRLARFALRAKASGRTGTRSRKSTSSAVRGRRCIIGRRSLGSSWARLRLLHDGVPFAAWLVPLGRVLTGIALWAYRVARPLVIDEERDGALA